MAEHFVYRFQNNPLAVIIHERADGSVDYCSGALLADGRLRTVADSENLILLRDASAVFSRQDVLLCHFLFLLYSSANSVIIFVYLCN